MRGVLIFTILSTEKRTLSIKTSTDALFFQKKKKTSTDEGQLYYYYYYYYQQKFYK